MKKHLNKVVIITGISGGIGRATAQYLFERGCKVYGISKSEFIDKRFTSFVADVNDYQKIESILNEIYEKEGRIDVIINNAGFGIAGTIEYTPPQKIYQIIDTNLSAVIAIMSMSIKFLKESKGNIINISSVGGIVPLPYQACYSASKSGIEIISRAVASEVKDYKIKVTALLPGDLNTGFTSARQKFGSGNLKVEHAFKKMENFERKGDSPIVVAKAIDRLIRQKNPPLRKTIGFGNKFVVFLMRILPIRLANFLVRKIYC